jgi:hypothetical protein
MDTVKPFKAAYHGYELENCPRGLGKWNSHMVMTDGNPDGMELLYRNIASLHRHLTRLI